MEQVKQEMLAIEETTKHAADENLRELSDLQLALVGGGSGDTIMH